MFIGDLAEERMFPIFPWFPPDDADIDGARWAQVARRDWHAGNRPSWCPAMAISAAPKFSSPFATYIVDLGRRVAAERKSGKDADAIVASLAPKVRAEHPDWSAPEWIDFAIKYHATLS